MKKFSSALDFILQGSSHKKWHQTIIRWRWRRRRRFYCNSIWIVDEWQGKNCMKRNWVKGNWAFFPLSALDILFAFNFKFQKNLRFQSLILVCSNWNLLRSNVGSASVDIHWCLTCVNKNARTAHTTNLCKHFSDIVKKTLALQRTVV